MYSRLYQVESKSGVMYWQILNTVKEMVKKDNKEPHNALKYTLY